jgi:hypothetical protein
MEFNRRTALAAIGLALTGCATPTRGKPPVVLVHGAWHGAWCWSRVVPLLAAAGYPVLTGAADRIAPRLKKLIYLDALVLADGESIASLSGPAWAERLKTVRAQGRGLGLPAPDPEAFGVLVPEDQAWIAPLLTAQPLNTFDQPLRLKHAFGNGLQKTYIDCTAPAMASVNSFKARVRRQPGWSLETLACGHDAMVIAPNELAAMLSRLS